MSDVVITALITAGFPVLATAITSVCQAKASRKNAAKDSILQMIMEDHLAVLENHLPTNYQNILKEYDIYVKNGGNSYVKDKVDDYKKWFVEEEKKKANKKGKK